MADRGEFFHNTTRYNLEPLINMEKTKERRILNINDIQDMAQNHAEMLHEDPDLCCIDGRSKFFGAGVPGADYGRIMIIKRFAEKYNIGLDVETVCDMIIESRGNDPDKIFGHTSHSDTGNLCPVTGCGHCMAVTKPENLAAYGLKKESHHWIKEAYQTLARKLSWREHIVKYEGDHEEGSVIQVLGIDSNQKSFNVFLPHRWKINGKEVQSFVYHPQVDEMGLKNLAGVFVKQDYQTTLNANEVYNELIQIAGAQLQATVARLAVYEGSPLPQYQIIFTNPNNLKEFKVKQLS